MTTTVDARGLACPQPVIQTRNAMRASDDVTTLVSGAVSVANVRRLAEKAGWRVTVSEHEGGFALHLVKGQSVAESQPEPLPAQALSKVPGGAVVVINSDQMGRGVPELGGILIRAFFHTLGELDDLPSKIIFYNTGVKLAVRGSPIVEDLEILEARGVEILACGTCLKYLEIADQLVSGSISNMYDIAEALLGDARVVTP